MKRSLLISLLALLGLLEMEAQPLSLRDAILIAQDSTITAHQSYNYLMSERSEYGSFLSGRLPQLSFNLTPSYRKAVIDPLLNYYKVLNYNMFNTLGELRLEQQALWSGGSYYVATGVLWTEYFGANAGIRDFSTVPFALGYSNSLIGYNPHKWDKKIRDYHIASMEKEYNYNLAKIALEAEKYYLDYLVARSIYDICESNSSVAATMLEIGREKFSIAAMSKNELCALELQYVNAENTLYNATQDVESARSSLLSYLNVEDTGQTIDPEEPDVPPYIVISLEAAISLANENNPKLRDYEEKVLSADRDLRKAKVETSFLRSSVDINLGMQGLKWYNDMAPYFVGGITLRIPIYDGGLARNKRNAAEYSLKNAKSLRDEADRKLELEVTNALREFNIQQDLIIRTRKALNLADESFELARELYGNGETDINTFILAQERKDEAHKNYLNSLRQYWNRYYTLMSLCVTAPEAINGEAY